MLLTPRETFLLLLLINKKLIKFRLTYAHEKHQFASQHILFLMVMAVRSCCRPQPHSRPSMNAY
jgi:hypothetical protein